MRRQFPPLPLQIAKTTATNCSTDRAAAGGSTTASPLSAGLGGFASASASACASACASPRPPLGQGFRLAALTGACAYASSSPGPFRPGFFRLNTPSSCASPPPRARNMPETPSTPERRRNEFKAIVDDVGAILFDFDGTLTATPGERAATNCQKQAELCERAAMLSPMLRALRAAGCVLGILSKSSEQTITTALKKAGLTEFFDGPVIGKAVGLEGKAGFIEELLAERGRLSFLGVDGARRVLLVDDDISELERALARGIQTYAAPREGGLQQDDLDDILGAIELHRVTGLAWTAAVGSDTPLTQEPHDLRTHLSPLSSSSPRADGGDGAEPLEFEGASRDASPLQSSRRAWPSTTRCSKPGLCFAAE